MTIAHHVVIQTYCLMQLQTPVSQYLTVSLSRSGLLNHRHAALYSQHPFCDLCDGSLCDAATVDSLQSLPLQHQALVRLRTKMHMQNASGRKWRSARGNSLVTQLQQHVATSQHRPRLSQHGSRRPLMLHSEVGRFWRRRRRRTEHGGKLFSR